MKPSEQIDAKIATLTDWRGERYAQLRKLINDTAPDLTEDWKWNTAVWSKNGNICALGAFKGAVKLNFFKGYQLQDPHGLINNGLDSKEHRAIDFFADSTVNEAQIADLLKEAVAKDL